MRLRTALAGVVTIVLALSPLARAAREYGGRYSREKVANLRANVEKFDWAAAQRDKAVVLAKPWLEKSDNELWHMVPGQDVPRTIEATFDRTRKGAKKIGCATCGDKIYDFGNYPWLVDIHKDPWKITCPNCKTRYPTNDFGKYYASGLNEHGLFDPSRADRSLLFNTDHPDPKDPKHKWGVDDGFGWIDENGHGHRWVGYYTWKYWREINAGLGALANAYLYTGDKVYARKAGILLDRIADVYPDMDWRLYAKRGWYHSDGNRIAGKIEGTIWETGVASNYADAYDKILSGTLDNAELFAFLEQKSAQYKLGPKGTREQFVAHLDKNLLQEIHDGVINGQINGNEGMHQRAMANAAMALNTQPATNEWLDWCFAPQGGAIPGLLMNKLDRDGASDEAAPGYAYFYGALFGDLGSLIDDYPAYTNHSIFREFPQFRACYTIAWRMAALGYATPNKGDHGTTGEIHAEMVTPSFIAEGFRRTGDPQLAIAAYHANGNKADGLGRDIYSADPDALSKKIQAIAAPAGSFVIKSDLMTGFGVAMLQSGTKESGAALPISFGRTTFHSHLDHLNFDLLAFNNWLLPDHGYPEYATAWPSRDEWTKQTISHNTVVVDGQPQKIIWGGHTKLYKSLPGLSVVTLDGKAAYPQTSRYERTMLLVDAPGGNHYVVDRFIVEGGSDHVYSIHGPPGETNAEGLNLVKQQTGTYAGPDIEPETSPKVKPAPIGYSYLFNVSRASKPANTFSIEWKAQAGYRNVKEGDDIRVRFFALSQVDDVALAEGKPPQTKAGNPRTLPYALLHRKGENLKSQFVSVIEPSKGGPFIERITREDQDGRVILQIEFRDGTEDRIEFGRLDENRVGFTREEAGKASRGIFIDGTPPTPGATDAKTLEPFTGFVKDMNRQLEGGGWIVVDGELPQTVVGNYIHVDTTTDRDATYRIESIEKVQGGTKLNCGPTAFVRGYLGETVDIRSQIVPKDYTAGFAYDFEVGAKYVIPTHTIWPAK